MIEIKLCNYGVMCNEKNIHQHITRWLFNKQLALTAIYMIEANLFVIPLKSPVVQTDDTPAQVLINH